MEGEGVPANRPGLGRRFGSPVVSPAGRCDVTKGAICLRALSLNGGGKTADASLNCLLTQRRKEQQHQVGGGHAPDWELFHADPSASRPFLVRSAQSDADSVGLKRSNS